MLRTLQRLAPPCGVLFTEIPDDGVSEFLWSLLGIMEEVQEWHHLATHSSTVWISGLKCVFFIFTPQGSRDSAHEARLGWKNDQTGATRVALSHTAAVYWASEGRWRGGGGGGELGLNHTQRDWPGSLLKVGGGLLLNKRSVGEGENTRVFVYTYYLHEDLDIIINTAN